MAEKEKKQDNDAIIKEALQRFDESQSGTKHNRDAYEADTRFALLAEQWPDKVKETRMQENRPCLTINKLPSFINQVVNDARQNKPGVMVGPVDNGADKDTAEVINGLVRSIERSSKADIAYDTAIDHSVTGGMGFFQLEIDYAHDQSFDLEIRIKRIANPLSVHYDVSSTEFDASDWDYAFVSELLTDEEFTEKYPKAAKVSFDGDTREYIDHWLDDEKIRVAQYWRRTPKKMTLVQYQKPDGSTVALCEEKLPDLAKMALSSMGIENPKVSDDELKDQFLSFNGLTEINRRDVDGYEVKRYTMTGVEILETEDWPGSTIPICPVWGREVIDKGKRHFLSMIRDAKDPQTMFNFWRTATTELVALAPKSPWVGPKGFIPKGQEGKWETANTRSHAVLEYNPSAGAAPQRTDFANVPAGALQESLNASDDMKAIIGIYDSSLGARSNETSGKAILARQREADVSNFHFIDNLHRAIQYAGQCIVELIPAVYSSRSTLRILGEDMKEEVVGLQGENAPVDAPDRLYDLNVGKYDVTVRSGPSYATQREETRETLVELMRAVPGSAIILGPALLKHMDFQGANEIADKLEALTPQPSQMPGQMPDVPGSDQIQ